MGMSTYSKHLRVSATADVYCELESIVREEFGTHPYSEIRSSEQLGAVFPDFIGLSHGFRYIIAGAQKQAIVDAMNANGGVPEHIELMNAVANMLTWDETGGMDLLASKGKSALPEILDVKRMHSSLLREDAQKILGYPVSPQYAHITRELLRSLYHGFAASDPIVRCAYMVAFEFHAGVIIDALWQAVSSVSELSCEELAYFKLHVGGDDPSEKYHIEMTQRLIAIVVPKNEQDRFVVEFTKAYGVQHTWAEQLVANAAASTNTTAEVHQHADVLHHGGCHCGAVTFEVLAPAIPEAVQCNCSVCDVNGFVGLIVPSEKFRVMAGADELTQYKFGTNVAVHTFCKVCGTKPFYQPRSHPNYVSVNVKCLDRATVLGIELAGFDGQNWEESIHQLRPESCASDSLSSVE